MTARPTSQLVQALLEPGPSAHKTCASDDDRPEPRKTVTIFLGAAVLGQGGPFRARGVAASVALLVFGDARKAFGERRDDETAHEAAATAAAVGVEHLRERCRVRVVTDSDFLLQTMRGDLRRIGHLRALARLDRALASRGHLAEWAGPGTDACRGAVAACNAAAASIAVGEEDGNAALALCVERSTIPLAATRHPDQEPAFGPDESDDDAPDARGGLLSAIGRDFLRGVAALARSVGKKRVEAG